MSKSEAIRITNAQPSREQDISARQKRYLWAMSLRTVCFVGALGASFAGIGWLWPVLIVGAIVLPYFAVVAANTTNYMSDGFQLREIELLRAELGPSKT